MSSTSGDSGPRNRARVRTSFRLALQLGLSEMACAADIDSEPTEQNLEDQSQVRREGMNQSPTRGVPCRRGRMSSVQMADARKLFGQLQTPGRLDADPVGLVIDPCQDPLILRLVVQTLGWSLCSHMRDHVK